MYRGYRIIWNVEVAQELASMILVGYSGICGLVWHKLGLVFIGGVDYTVYQFVLTGVSADCPSNRGSSCCYL